MKGLVLYRTRCGNTTQVAEALADGELRKAAAFVKELVASLPRS